MARQGAERRLVAILSADVAGYSRLMNEDEAGTLANLKALRAECIDPEIASHGGRIVKLMGDGDLVEFNPNTSGPDVDGLAFGTAREFFSEDLFSGGADVNAVHVGDEVPAASDTVIDFEIGADTLDLSDIFSDAGVASPVEGLHYAFSLVDSDHSDDPDTDTDDTAVHVDTTGSGDFSGDPVVVLLNVTPGQVDTDPNSGNVDV